MWTCNITCLQKSHRAWTCLQARFVTLPNGRKHKILYFMEIALSNSYQLLISWKGAHLSFYFHYSWFYVEITTQNVNFPIGPVQYTACQNTQRETKMCFLFTMINTWSRRLLVFCAITFIDWCRLNVAAHEFTVHWHVMAVYLMCAHSTVDNGRFIFVVNNSQI